MKFYSYSLWSFNILLLIINKFFKNINCDINEEKNIIEIEMCSNLEGNIKFINYDLYAVFLFL